MRSSRHRRRAARPVLAGAVTLILAATAGCGNDSDDVDTGTGTGPGSASEPGGADNGLFIEIADVGGFLPVEFVFSSTPRIVVLDDGTSLTPGAVPAIFPGPAVMPLFESVVPDEDLARLLDLAGDAGLLGPAPDTGNDDLPIADASSTRVTVVADGEAHVVEVYALGMEEGIQTNLTEDQEIARRTIANFVAEVERTVLEAETGGQPVVYEPAAYRVLPSSPDAAGAPDVPPNTLDWPAPGVALVDGTCATVADDDATALTATLADATQITRWRTDDGTEHLLAIRPVLPHEDPACPA